MRRLSLLITAALAAAATALVLAVGGSAQGNPNTIQLVERTVQNTQVHNPPKGFSQGDEFVFRSKLTDTSGQRAGTDGGYCIFTKAARRSAVAECSASLFLSDGKISVSGGANLGGRKVLLPVVGGTGAYEGAQGTLLVEERKGNKSDLTVNLQP